MKPLRRLAVALLAAAACAGAAAAQTTGGEAEPQPLDDAELTSLRGGYLTVDGLRFDFAAEIRTTIDGQPVLVSRMNWTPEGPQFFDVEGRPMAAPAGLGSLLLPGEGGSTLVAHRLADGQLQGFILNSANGRELRQDLDITITLPGFEMVQRDIGTALTGLQIGREVADGALRSSGAP